MNEVSRETIWRLPYYFRGVFHRINPLSKRRGGFDEANVRSSNLGHYLGVLHAADCLPAVSHILHAFSCPGRREPIYADVVAGDGRIWVKVVARKAQALHLVWAGRGQYGERDLMFQGEEYVNCAREHPVNFVKPRVIFAFYNGVTAPMARATRRLGIEVLGNEVEVDAGIEHMLQDLDLSDSDDTDDDSYNDVSVMSYRQQKSDLEKNSCLEKGIVSSDPKTRHSFNDGYTLYERHDSGLVNSTCLKESMEGSAPLTKSPSDGSTCSYQKQEAHCFKSPSLDMGTQGNGDPGPDENTSIPTHKTTGLFNNDVYSTEASIGERSCQSSHSNERIELSAIGTLNQGKKNNSPRSNVDGYTCDSITYTLHSKEQQTSGRAGETNQAHLNKSNPQSSLGMPRLNEVCATGRQFGTDNDVNLSKVTCGPGIQGHRMTDYTHSGNQSMTDYQSPEGGAVCENNDTAPEMGRDHVTNPSYEELLMSPLIEYTHLCSVLTGAMDNETDGIRKVNMDVSSLITLVSAVTHGRCAFRFKEKVLSEQAADERRESALPQLETFLKGKELYACETAVQSFMDILNLLGGHGEVTRAEYLLKQITVVPDNTSFRTQSLPNTGKIKDRSKIVFGTGDSLKAVTLTANSAFVRSARHQGCQYAAHIHPARALTEKKEETAEVLERFKDVHFHSQCDLFPDICPDITYGHH